MSRYVRSIRFKASIGALATLLLSALTATEAAPTFTVGGLGGTIAEMASKAVRTALSDSINYPDQSPGSRPVSDPPAVRVPPGMIGRYPLSLTRPFSRTYSLLEEQSPGVESEEPVRPVPRFAIGFDALRGLERSFRLSLRARVTRSVAIEVNGTHYAEPGSNPLPPGIQLADRSIDGISDVIPWSVSAGVRAYPLSDDPRNGTYLAFSVGVGWREGIGPDDKVWARS